MAMSEKRLISKEKNKIKDNRRQKYRGGEEWRSDRGGRCHHVITGQCPCYGQVYSTAARQGSCAVPCNAPATFYATFHEIYGGKPATRQYD